MAETPSFRFHVICNFRIDDMGSAKMTKSEIILQIKETKSAAFQLIQWPGSEGVQSLSLGTHMNTLIGILIRYQMKLTPMTAHRI